MGGFVLMFFAGFLTAIAVFAVALSSGHIVIMPSEYIDPPETATSSVPPIVIPPPEPHRRNS